MEPEEEQSHQATTRVRVTEGEEEVEGAAEEEVVVERTHNHSGRKSKDDALAVSCLRIMLAVVGRRR
jgi:hypothetical protein